jgi:hypothetical protein
MATILQMPLVGCSSLPFEKGKTHVLTAIPWITDSTTVQNIVIIAIVSKLQRRSSYTSLKPYRFTAENKVAMSLHLHHVPQADMLECRPEILQIVPHPNNLTFEYAAPMKGVITMTYCQMTHVWWLLWKELLTRVNSTNVQYEGLRIGGVGRRMNSKVKSVKTRCVSKVNVRWCLSYSQSVPLRPLLAPIYRWPGLKDWEGPDID